MDDSSATAQACARAMYDNDAASQALGMTIEACGPGWARVSMTVRSDMTNGMDICHGGIMFSLCDSTFAFACNAYDRRTVAAGATIEFLAPARVGDRLIAEAKELSRAGRTGVYDVTLTRADGTLVALFRGRSHEIRGRVLEPPVGTPSVGAPSVGRPNP